MLDQIVFTIAFYYFLCYVFDQQDLANMLFNSVLEGLQMLNKNEENNADISDDVYDLSDSNSDSNPSDDTAVLGGGDGEEAQRDGDIRAEEGVDAGVGNGLADRGGDGGLGHGEELAGRDIFPEVIEPTMEEEVTEAVNKGCDYLEMKDMSRGELLLRAKELHIKHRNRMAKEELILAILAAE
jgi:hypothetical protein